MLSLATAVYVVTSLAIIGLHLALVLGAPWGVMTMGGQVRGKLPIPMRFASLGQALLLIYLALIVVETAGLASFASVPDWDWLIWCPVGVSAVSLVLNSITPSRPERLFGVPMTALLFAGSLVVAVMT